MIVVNASEKNLSRHNILLSWEHVFYPCMVCNSQCYKFNNTAETANIEILYIFDTDYVVFSFLLILTPDIFSKNVECVRQGIIKWIFTWYAVKLKTIFWFTL